MNDILLACISVFISAFISATMLPGYSEAVLVATIISHPHNPILLWLAAATGNTLGSMVTWLMGRFLLHFQDRQWFPFKADKLERTRRWYKKYGVWSLLMAWAPVIGDALPLIAGIMRANVFIVFVLCFIGKSLRYFVIIQMTLQTLT